MKKTIFITAIIFYSQLSPAQQKSETIESAVAKIESKCIAWRRDFHQNPELGNRELRTARIISEQLRSLGIEVKENIAKTGVVGILRGAKPGPVIGLRADMDALPVTETTGLSFASKTKTIFNGQELGVMHACGHDAHVAMLLSVAEILSGMKKDLAGTVKFIFQPAEEGPPNGEEGGAPLMIREGVLDNPKVDVVFGLHINAQTPIGEIKYREQGVMAESDWFTIKIHGKQSHGAQPWLGIDPVVIGSQIILGLQTVVSRQSELTKDPVVISTTIFKAGVRENIIPEEVTLAGTIRTLDTSMRNDVYQRMERTVKNIAAASGATGAISFVSKTMITYNDPQLTNLILPSLKKATDDHVSIMDAQTQAEDFSYFSAKVPSVFFFLGGMTPGVDPKTTAAHHTPGFMIDEAGMKTGIKAFCYIVTDYMKANQTKTSGKSKEKSF
ncbi:MAG: amidohydrolase [Flavisolibacter sp.]